MRTENHGFLLEDMINLYSIVTNDKYEYTVKSGLRIKEVSEFFGVTTNNARKLVCRPWKKSKYKPVLETKVKYDRKKYQKLYDMTHDRTEYFREYHKRRRIEMETQKKTKTAQDQMKG